MRDQRGDQSEDLPYTLLRSPRQLPKQSIIFWNVFGMPAPSVTLVCLRQCRFGRARWHEVDERRGSDHRGLQQDQDATAGRAEAGAVAPVDRGCPLCCLCWRRRRFMRRRLICLHLPTTAIPAEAGPTTRLSRGPLGQRQHLGHSKVRRESAPFVPPARTARSSCFLPGTPQPFSSCGCDAPRTAKDLQKHGRDCR